MGEYPQIKFEDIQIGDVIRHVGRAGVTREGKVWDITPSGRVYTAEGGLLAWQRVEGDVYLVYRDVKEPTGLWAVVEAHTEGDRGRRLFARDFDGDWLDSDGNYFRWHHLVNPEVKHEGWVQSED